MNKQLFTNSVTINASKDLARQILVDPLQLLKWVPEITAVDQGHRSFIVTRAQAALNQREVMTVEEMGDRIIYHSRRGRLEYDLIFTLRQIADNRLQLEEALMTDESKTKLPLKLLAPIAKHALKLNLKNLGLLIERVTVA